MTDFCFGKKIEKKERNWPVCRSFGASIERAALDSSSSSYFGTVWEICQWHMRKCRHVPIIDGAQHTVLQSPARYPQCSSPSNTIGPILAEHTNTLLFVWPLIDVFSLSLSKTFACEQKCCWQWWWRLKKYTHSKAPPIGDNELNRYQ